MARAFEGRTLCDMVHPETGSMASRPAIDRVGLLAGFK